jgi:hypothetical protein
MVAFLNPSDTLLRKERRFAPAAGRPPPNRADVIWTLHRTLVDPRADRAAVKRAKSQLLGAVTAADSSLRIIVPPLAPEERLRGPIHFHEKHNSN